MTGNWTDKIIAVFEILEIIPKSSFEICVRGWFVDDISVKKIVGCISAVD